MADNPLRYQVRTVLGVVDPIGDQRGCKMEEWITLLQANFIPEGQASDCRIWLPAPGKTRGDDL